MVRNATLFSVALFAIVGLGLAGCGQAESTSKATGEKATADKTTAPVAATPAAAAADETPAGLKELSEADRKAAEKQKVCPVSGEKLGSMGKPFKVQYKGRDVFLCCDGCKADFDKDPEKYIKKLDAPSK